MVPGERVLRRAVFRRVLKGDFLRSVRERELVGGEKEGEGG